METQYTPLPDDTNNKKLFEEEEKTVKIQYSIYDRRDDPRFGSLDLLKNKSDVFVAKVEHEIMKASKEDNTKFVEYYFKRKTLKHKDLVDLLHIYGTKVTKYSGKVMKYTILFQFFNNDLKIELKLRKIQNNSFTIVELWKIAKNIFNALFYLYEQKYCFEFYIRPMNICLMKSKGKFKAKLMEFINDKKNLMSGRTYNAEKNYSNLQDNLNKLYQKNLKALGFILLECAGLSNSYFHSQLNNRNKEFHKQEVQRIKHKYNYNEQKNPDNPLKTEKMIQQKKQLIDLISNLVLIEEKNLIISDVRELYFKESKMNERYTL